MASMRFRIGDKEVGEGCPVFVIAEIGYNFNTLDEAKAGIDAALAAGADAVKFQTFRAETVAARGVDFPEEAGATSQFDEFKRYELSEEAHFELFSYSMERGILPLSTPSYYDDVDLLEKLGIAAYKIGSDDLTNLPFISHVARLGKPMILSTGMSDLSEVALAREAVRAAGNEQLAFLHCVSNYPIRDMSVVNLRAIETLRRALSVPIGFSDHTTTMTAALGAVALGATIVEKHFTASHDIDAPDVPFSATPPELKALVDAIRDLSRALGSGEKRPAKTEVDMRRDTRKSVVAKVPIAGGQVIGKDDIIVKRPGRGIPPSLAHLVPGRRAKQAILADETITWEKLD